jgi:hypothetical protein
LASSGTVQLSHLIALAVLGEPMLGRQVRPASSPCLGHDLKNPGETRVALG